MKLTLTFDTSEQERDFYNVITKINFQHFKDSVGIESDEDLLTVTEKEKKDYVEGVLAENIVNTYLASKIQAEVLAFQVQQQEANKDRIVPVKPLTKREKV